MEVDIPNDRSVRLTRVNQVCTLELFREGHPVDLIPIHLRESKVIMGMDSLSPNKAMVDCEHPLVCVLNPK